MKERIEINPAYESLRRFIELLPSTFDSSGEVIFKGRNEVRVITAPDGTEFVVKRFGRLPLVRKLIYSTVERSKARRAYEYGLQFIKLGIDTPEPVAYLEIYSSGLLADVFFVSLKSDYKALFGPLVEAEEFNRELAGEVARLMSDLHSQGALHGDPNLNNILYNVDRDGKARLQVIDTNRSSFGRRLTTDNCLKNLMRVSHRRDLLQYVTEQYADLRGLDRNDSVSRVMKYLDNFERNREIRHRLKRIILNKK